MCQLVGAEKGEKGEQQGWEDTGTARPSSPGEVAFEQGPEGSEKATS